MRCCRIQNLRKPMKNQSFQAWTLEWTDSCTVGFLQNPAGLYSCRFLQGCIPAASCRAGFLHEFHMFSSTKFPGHSPAARAWPKGRALAQSPGPRRGGGCGGRRDPGPEPWARAQGPGPSLGSGPSGRAIPGNCIEEVYIIWVGPGSGLECNISDFGNCAWFS